MMWFNFTYHQQVNIRKRFGSVELGVAIIVFCRLLGFVSFDKSHFFYHSLASAGTDAGDGRSLQHHSCRSVILVYVSMPASLGRSLRPSTAFPMIALNFVSNFWRSLSRNGRTTRCHQYISGISHSLRLTAPCD